MDILTSQ